MHMSVRDVVRPSHEEGEEEVPQHLDLTLMFTNGRNECYEETASRGWNLRNFLGGGA